MIVENQKVTYIQLYTKMHLYTKVTYAQYSLRNVGIEF